jgi:hypothetical protein
VLDAQESGSYTAGFPVPCNDCLHWPDLQLGHLVAGGHFATDAAYVTASSLNGGGSRAGGGGFRCARAP